MEYTVYGDLIMIYPKTYSTYLRGTIGLYSGVHRGWGLKVLGFKVEGPWAQLWISGGTQAGGPSLGGPPHSVIVV